MVIVPHEDDEINVAGAFIYGAIQAGLHVICVYLTNGDWFYPAQVRISEAQHALEVLGVRAENLIVLGYPDGGVHAEQNIFAYGKINTVKTRQGNYETYGACGYKDFSYAEYGHHASYCWGNFLADLKNVILKYKPDLITAVDMDFHPDHKMCSIAVDMVMADILKQEGNTYFPEVLKGFAYNTTYGGIEDLQNVNLLSTRCDHEKVWNTALDTDNPAFEWEARIRFPVIGSCRNILLWKNPVFRALSAHVSQRAFERSGRIINGDQIFWRKRTDNLALCGEMSVSSGNPEYLHDFQFVRFQDISAKQWNYAEYVWKPNKKDHEKWCRCTFAQPKHIEKMVFYGNIAERERILGGEILFSNGNRYNVGAIRKWGKPTIWNIPQQDDVYWVQFHIIETESPEAGLAEWEIFAGEKASYQILHILCDEEFAYDWYVLPNHIPKIGLYAYGVNSEMQWYWDNMPCTIDDINDRCKCLTKSVVIRVEAKNKPEIFSEIQLHPWSIRAKAFYKLRILLNRLAIKYVRYREKPAHHRAKKQAVAFNSQKT